MWTILIAVAAAYEVDAWTPRTIDLDDATLVANAAFEGLLDRAVGQVRCSGDDEVLRRRLARRIDRVTARRMRLPERAGLAAFGHGIYSGWLEVDPSVARVTTGRGGIFEGVGLLDGSVLHLAGTASTVRIGDTLIGTDKIDHFLATGYDYFRWSHATRSPERAVRRGVRTERLLYGRLSSKAFSYADLAANWDGYQFYASLLAPDSPLQRGEHSCVTRVSAWDWSAWVQDDWDEFLNPSVYGPRVQRALHERLDPEQGAICAQYTATDLRIPLSGRTPPQRGPLGLGWSCHGAPSPP